MGEGFYGLMGSWGQLMAVRQLRQYQFRSELGSYQIFDSVMSIENCPVVYPTWAQFNDFLGYTEYLEKTYSSKYGMVKVVPPTGWKASSKGYSNVDTISISGPIEQNAYGRGGVYECMHISCKSMTVGDFRKKTKSFQHVTDGLSHEQVEELFWKNIAFSSPLYAADIQMSLMDESSGSWNLNSLDSVLSAGMKFPLPGVNTPYCYFGSWKSFFCWHTEDMELAAINFLHAGKTKYWYSIRLADRDVIESEGRLEFPSRFQKCPEHIRHKTTVLNPYRLKGKYPNLQIHKQIQNPGEFILAFSGAYHCGFNSGFNIAEAVNYANMSWLKMIKTAKSCKCRNDSVMIHDYDLACQLMNSKLKKKAEVIQFYKSVQPQEDQNTKDSNSKRAIKEKKEDKSLIDKAVRHHKIKKDTKKIEVKGRVFKIDTWAQCEKCQKWRKTDAKLNKLIKQKPFVCKLGGSTCQKKEQKSKQYITLSKVKA